MFGATGYGQEPEPSASIKQAQQCRHFDLFDILLATENFDESLVIGRGGFGKVYRGAISSGSETVVAAIKRLDPNSNQGAPEFWAEVEMLSKLRHCNLVSLFGYCNDEEEMILVYEYMPNGTLEDHLHKLGTPLSWVQRLKICIGAGRGLHYLHTGAGIDVGVIHRDVKTSNILLQESWAAKISDFGLSKIGPTNQPMTYVNTLVKGTFAYIDPDYYATGNLTRKSDVYAFGEVLLEVLCRKRAIFNIDGVASNLANWAQESIKVGNLKNIVDFDIRGQISPKCSKEFVRIAERCLHGNPKQRSTMAEVLVSLEAVLILQEKFNNSVQTAGRTIFGRMVNMLSFPSNGENTASSDPDKGSEGCFQLKGLRSFTFEELKTCTNNFSATANIGSGGYGMVYKGSLPNGQLVAVKRSHQRSTQGAYEFKTDVHLISRIHHKNLVSLIGFCFNQGVQMLVYEYMVNGTLEDGLSGRSGIRLDWMRRLKIIRGAARGLQYLHDECMMHKNIKTTNILLDERLNAKVADFGLSNPLVDSDSTHVTTQVKGTIGYIDPDYFLTAQLTDKSDVYSFGIVMLELITARNPIEKGKNIVTEIKEAMDKEKVLYNLHEVLDPMIIGLSSELQGLERFVDVALRCVEVKGIKRPQMSEVVKEIENIMELAGLNVNAEFASTSER